MLINTAVRFIARRTEESTRLSVPVSLGNATMSQSAVFSAGLSSAKLRRRIPITRTPSADSLSPTTCPIFPYPRITAVVPATQVQCGLIAPRGLAAGVAHEIGNPLNAISLNIQMLERDPTDKESIEICKQQIRRLDGILRGFLSALRPQRPNLMPGSVADPLKSCLATLRQQFEEHRINVTLDVPAALPSVALDANQMEQVFFNLLKNALEALPDGGAIAIALTADDDTVSVRFQDNGVGMTSEQLAHLFEPYRTSKEHGTGLGLMITSRIVKDHGGSIATESEPGKGTTFTIKLPRFERRIRALK